MGSVISWFTPFVQFIDSIPSWLMLGWFVWLSLSLAYDLRLDKLRTLAAFNGILFLFALMCLALVSVARNLYGINLVSFTEIWLTPTLGHTIHLPPPFFLGVAGLFSSFILLGTALFHIESQPNDKSTVGAKEGSRPRPNSSSKSTSTLDTGTIFAAQSGPGKSSSSKGDNTTSTNRPEVVGVGGPAMPVSRSGDGLIIYDNLPTHAQPIGGNLYRSGDGRTWSLDSSGLSAHPVSAAPGAGFFGSATSSGGGGGNTDWDFGGSGGLGTGIGVLWFAAPVVITIYGIIYSIASFVQTVVTTVTSAITVFGTMLGLGLALFVTTLIAELILVHFFARLRHWLDTLSLSKILTHFHLTFSVFMAIAVFAGIVMECAEGHSQSSHSQRYWFDFDAPPQAYIQETPAVPATEDPDLHFVDKGIRSNWIPSMCSAYLYDDQYRLVRTWALHRANDKRGFNAIGYYEDGSMAMRLNFDDQRKLQNYVFVSRIDRDLNFKVIRRDQNGAHLTSTVYRLGIESGVPLLKSVCSTTASAVVTTEYCPSGVPEFTLTVYSTDKRVIKKMSWSNKPDCRVLNTYFDLFSELGTKYMPSLQTQ